MRSASHSTPTDAPRNQIGRVLDLAALYFRLGLIAFGGPAAHIALMREEVVARRKWLDDQHFLDLLGATNLIPGPNSSEMAIHVGYLHAGFAGMLVAGLTWMTPAFLIVLGLSWAYVEFGTTPVAVALLYGIKPVIIPIIVQALIALGQKAVKGWLTALVGVAALGAYLLGADVLLSLVVGGLAVMAVTNIRRLRAMPMVSARWLTIPVMAAAPFTVGVMLLTFLKIGAVLYGSGYTLFVFMHDDFVARLGWLTEQQLIDAIAVGQMTPGPLFTTTTFVGYVLGVKFGQPPLLLATLATLAFYLPSFVFVALSNPLVPRLRHSTWAASILDGVNVAALGAMAGVTLTLGRAALIDLPTLAIGLIAALALFRFKVSSVWLVIGGAAAGWLVGL